MYVEHSSSSLWDSAAWFQGPWRYSLAHRETVTAPRTIWLEPNDFKASGSYPECDHAHKISFTKYDSCGSPLRHYQASKAWNYLLCIFSFSTQELLFDLCQFNIGGSLLVYWLLKDLTQINDMVFREMRKRMSQHVGLNHS